MSYRAIFVSRTGLEFSRPIVSSKGKLFVEQPNGTLVDFADEIQDPVLGNAVWIETVPPDAGLQPENRRTIRHLREIGL
jgi:hypothetical protein